MTKGWEAAAEALMRLLDCGSIRHRRRSHPRPPIEREDRRTGRVLGALARDAIAPRNDIVVNPFELPVEGGQLVVPPQIRKAHHIVMYSHFSSDARQVTLCQGFDSLGYPLQMFLFLYAPISLRFEGHSHHWPPPSHGLVAPNSSHFFANRA